ncbi:response regulator transcription factor [Methylomonas sp. CM2]|uniref:response regulator transcription factor n=1 Tax=Methylomonas sp. CM2 TaxID=3417647 RepID=UPI003CF91A6B
MIRAELRDAGELTPREAEVLRAVAEGAPDKVIAQLLGISIKTVGAHLDRVYIKLKVQDARINARCAAISVAVARGMIALSTRALCLMLAVGLSHLDGHALRSRTRLARVRVGSVQVREA